MVKFTAAGDDKILVGLGLEAGNVERLKQGRPILVNLQDLGFTQPIEVMIFYGESKELIVSQLKPYIGKGTVVHGEEKPSDG